MIAIWLSKQRSSATSIWRASEVVTPLRRAPRCCRRLLALVKTNFSECKNNEFDVICGTLSDSDRVVRKRKHRHTCTPRRQSFAQNHTDTLRMGRRSLYKTNTFFGIVSKSPKVSRGSETLCSVESRCVIPDFVSAERFQPQNSRTPSLSSEPEWVFN